MEVPELLELCFRLVPPSQIKLLPPKYKHALYTASLVRRYRELQATARGIKRKLEELYDECRRAKKEQMLSTYRSKFEDVEYDHKPSDKFLNQCSCGASYWWLIQHGYEPDCSCADDIPSYDGGKVKCKCAIHIVAGKQFIQLHNLTAKQDKYYLPYSYYHASQGLAFFMKYYLNDHGRGDVMWTYYLRTHDTTVKSPRYTRTVWRDGPYEPKDIPFMVKHPTEQELYQYTVDEFKILVLGDTPVDDEDVPDYDKDWQKTTPMRC